MTIPNSIGGAAPAEGRADQLRLREESPTVAGSRLIVGNCVDVMREWPEDCIDLTVTSPPYDGIRDYNGYSFEFESIARELLRVTRPGGVVNVTVRRQTPWRYRQMESMGVFIRLLLNNA